jgi:hypothetical protein
MGTLLDDRPMLQHQPTYISINLLPNVNKCQTNAKQAEASCKTGGPFSWSQMPFAAGLAVQLAN